MSGQNERVLDQFTRQASAYAALVNETGKRADPLLKVIGPKPSDRLLDVGCGSGQFAVAVAAQVREVVGVDLTPAMLKQARAHAAKVGGSNVRWELADASVLPVAESSFDVVVSRSMLHHAADPAAVLREMQRASAPAGRIYVSDLSPNPLKAPAFDAIELLRDPSHRHALTLQELRGLGQTNGLKEIEVQSAATSLPLEAVLATSFPPAGMLDHVRSLLARDADAGTDTFGLSAYRKDGATWVTYPTVIVGWSPR